MALKIQLNGEVQGDFSSSCFYIGSLNNYMSTLRTVSFNLACSRLRGSGEKSFSKKKCKNVQGYLSQVARVFARFNSSSLYYLRAWHCMATFDLPRKVGKRKEPLPPSSTIHIELAPNSNFSALSIKPLPQHPLSLSNKGGSTKPV